MPGRADLYRRCQAVSHLNTGPIVAAAGDVPALVRPVTAASASGVSMVRWQRGNSTEAEIVLTLDTGPLRDLLLLAAELNTVDPVRDAVVQRLSEVAPPGDLDPGAWVEAGHSLDEIRAAVAEAAKKKEWFKREEKGEALGNFITERWDHFAFTDVSKRLAELRAFRLRLPPHREPKPTPGRCWRYRASRQARGSAQHRRDLRQGAE